jgi:hypothetical protein
LNKSKALGAMVCDYGAYQVFVVMHWKNTHIDIGKILVEPKIVN